jgi:hypothetical protein
MKKSGRFLCLFFWVVCCCGRLPANEFGYVTPGIDYP